MLRAVRILIKRMSIDLINSDFVMYEESVAVGENKQVNRKALSSHVIQHFEMHTPFH